MMFSIISIISNVLTHCTQREIAKSTGWVSVQFRVTGNGVNQNGNRMRYRQIQQEFAAILEIDKSLIGMARPMIVLHGLKMEMSIYLNHTQSIDMNIQETLQRHIGSGVIAKIFKKSWNLQNVPIVSNLSVERIESELRKEGTVQLSHSDGDIAREMTVYSQSSGSTINMSPTSMTSLDQFPLPQMSSEIVTMTPTTHGSPGASEEPGSPKTTAQSPVSTIVFEGEGE